MIRKIVFWASLPMLVVPFISVGAAPATATSLQGQPKLTLELLSSSNRKSVLIADENRNGDYNQRHNSDYYRRWYNNHHNQYNGYSYRWYNNHYHGDYDHYYRWYHDRYNH